MRTPEIGTSHTLEYTVRPEDAATFDGEMIHPVYSTPSVVRTMERAARLALLPYLEEGEVGAGHEVHVIHRAPAPIGAHVRVTATITAHAPRRLTCTTVTNHGDRVIATGTVVQGIVAAADFRSRYEAAQDAPGPAPGAGAGHRDDPALR
ncbi:thioesterase family protein [Georgenia sp. H159]|uniref:thioesterase family protein n=1 Tax=Georgenia sp. H159 TaxID=3076115 RepID=UPI002D7941B0|nr:hypothetical protein [Georgenia sp. H159]